MSKLSKRRDSSGSDASTTSRIPISYTPTLPRKQRGNLSRHQSLVFDTVVEEGIYFNEEEVVSTNLVTSSHSIRSSRGDDVDSVCSGSSSICDHSHFAKNGSTYSGRCKKYIVHCSPQHTDPDEYLTPTQRANATIRKLKSMLSDAQSEVAARDEEISRLSRELVQLRLGSVDNSVQGDEGDSPGRKQGVPERMSPHSLSDSGHFEELSPEPSVHRNQLSPCQVSPSVNVDALIQKLAEANERYYELKPQYEDLCRRYENLEFEKAELQAKFETNEESHRKTYLEMFRKGQEAARFQAEDKVESDNQTERIPQLLKELEVTKAELESVKTMYRKLLESNQTKKEDDAEITLKFLKSAFYYFLTDRENTTGHLSAIQSILGFTVEEKQAIERAFYGWK